MTSNGPMRVKSLIGRSFLAVVDGAKYPSTCNGFFQTGTQDVYRLKTKSGHSLKLTGNHEVSVYRNGQKIYVPASELCQSDLVVINDNNKFNQWGDSSPVEKAVGLLLGLFIASGHIKDDMAYIDLPRSDKTSELIETVQESVKSLGVTLNMNTTLSNNVVSIQCEWLMELLKQYEISTDGCISHDSPVLTASSTLQRAFIYGVIKGTTCLSISSQSDTTFVLTPSLMTPTDNLEIIQKISTHLGFNTQIYPHQELQIFNRMDMIKNPHKIGRAHV